MLRLIVAWFLGLLAAGCSSARSHPSGGTFATSGTGGAAASQAGGGSGASLPGASGDVPGYGGQGSETSSSSSSSSSSSASSGSGGPNSPDAGGMAADCQTDADCPGGTCTEITPGGFRGCQTPSAEATHCSHPDLDQCCPGQVACPNGQACLRGPLVPLCQGIPVVPYNQCAVDQCQGDADCLAGSLCMKAGMLGLQIRACRFAGCRVNADCNAFPGGLCAPVADPCCHATVGLFCVYASNGGCRRNDDCPAPSPNIGASCWPDTSTGVASCQVGSPLCPQ